MEAAILVSLGMKVLQAAPAASPSVRQANRPVRMKNEITG
jgi:hypothetical protein